MKSSNNQINTLILVQNNFVELILKKIPFFVHKFPKN